MKYKLPFSKDVKYKTTNPEGDYVHENYPECRYAIDFVVPINTPVYKILASDSFFSNNKRVFH